MYNKNTSMEALHSIADALTANGIEAIVVANKEEAKSKLLELIPLEAQVLTMTSITLQTIGLIDALEGRGQPLVRTILMDPESNQTMKRQVGAAPDISVASAHAITEKGEIVIVSGSGSQLPAVVYGAGTAILVVGNQKIVADVDEAMKRIYEYVLPLESERFNAAYGKTTGSSVNKILIIKKEISGGRIKVILVGEPLGF